MTCVRCQAVEAAPSPCVGCGHAKRNHVNGVGLCLVASCRLCLSYGPSPTANGTRVECGGCGRVFEGPKARTDHAVHFQIERARAALRGDKEETGA